jgi:hypothetical protein
MKRSTERILVSHAGVLPRPPEFQELLAAGTSNTEALNKRLPTAVNEIVQKQVTVGIDVVNDGEFSKRGWLLGLRQAPVQRDRTHAPRGRSCGGATTGQHRRPRQ